MSKIVPFGKYKGQPVELLTADRNYCEWLAGQDWFREKFAELHLTIVNCGNEPVETPEHNRMQAQFLDFDICRALVKALISSASLISSELLTEEEVALECVTLDIIERKPWNEMAVGGLLFEDKGWDVSFSLAHGTSVCCVSQKELTPSYSYYDRSDTWNNRTYLDFSFRERFCVECKPSLGDDYPAVLRQIKARPNEGYRVLLINRFAAIGADYEQVKKFYLNSRIHVLLESELKL